MLIQTCRSRTASSDVVDSYRFRRKGATVRLKGFLMQTSDWESRRMV